MGSILHSTFGSLLGKRPPAPSWHDKEPVRRELFGVERLEQFAESLATEQRITDRVPRVPSLQHRLDDNAAVLLAAYRAGAAELARGHRIVPAAEWLLDNYHLVEEQVREIRNDMPPGFYRQLPKLAAGPFAGYPRVFGLAWAFVAHTDSHFDPDTLCRFIRAYQRVQPLTIGELWAVAITLRIVLVENLRRLADQITAHQRDRTEADTLATRLLGGDATPAQLVAELSQRATEPLSQPFVAQLAKRLRDQDPAVTPALEWLADQLRLQGSSVDEMVQLALQRQGASNLTVRNIITSMRLISDIDWAVLFESVSLVDERLRGSGTFAAMDFPSRDLYRNAIEELARGCPVPELDIAERAVNTAREAAAATGDAATAARVGDPGYHLIGAGRRAFEQALGFRPSLREHLRRLPRRLGITGYFSAIALSTLTLLALALWALPTAVGPGWLTLFLLIGFWPATEAATALTNRLIASVVGATPLPGLELKKGVPSSLRTLVVVPTLLTSEADLLLQVEQLEVHHLTGADGDIAFALLLDGVDADREEVEGEARLLRLAAAAIRELNQRHGPAPCGDRFLLLYRRRLFNAAENTWMAWERKRGKLHELNRLLRGATDTTFTAIDERPPQVPEGVRYVITLDADTRLPRNAAQRLVGKMAHPLNHPIFCEHRQRVVGGYGVLQPRVTPSLPSGHGDSPYQRIFSSPGGMDPYAAAVSDVYQDLFGEGSYTGKGIYDVDAFEAALAGRVADNTLLSHDLFEGAFARAGLATDIEVVEEFPSRYDVATRRQHRWTRGDWQLLPWITALGRAATRLSAVNRAKMLDNLRRSLLAPFTLLAFGAAWLLPWPQAATATLLLLAAIALPAFLPTLFALRPPRAIPLRSHLSRLHDDLQVAALRTLATVAFLPDQAWQMADAIARTLARLLVTRRHLLEWTTSAQVALRPQPDLAGFYRQMAAGTALGLAVAIGALIANPAVWSLAVPLALLWLAAPAFARWASSAAAAEQQGLTESEARELRHTWRFFETFVTAVDNHLPPDNFQETPAPVVAHRTSPTNMGLYLLSAVAARDFGWSGTVETTERIEATLAAMQQLPRFNGHLFNWYDTQDLRPLEPAYVSAVDSGNLAGHLLVLANACEEWMGGRLAATARAGIRDTCQLARQALTAVGSERGRQLTTLLDEIDTRLQDDQAIESLLPPLSRLAEKAAQAAAVPAPAPAPTDDDSADLVFWINALKQTIAEHSRDRRQLSHAGEMLDTRLKAVADAARALALGMDFSFLVDPDRKLLSIGYAIAEGSLDASCYDLLASEARLASLFAIAKGDVPTQHWFRLGRTVTPVGGGSALISWSGSMFEYLMPALVVVEPTGSLLEQTNRLVVARQQAHGRTLGIPWGISESAYNARDMEFTYQYTNFGVPGLGLKRGLADNVVVAPYATALAAMVDPRGAHRNYRDLAALGAKGRYGFYEAVDFTRSRLPEDQQLAIVRNFMAHHQGMTIVAIANTLQDGCMRARFHREPMIQACELLLQERAPRHVQAVQPRADETEAPVLVRAVATPAVRRLKGASDGAPVTKLLSNGRYTVMLTAAGAGYSRWHDIAVTRWREDATRDAWGSFIFLRDIDSGSCWSAGVQPLGDADHEEVVFSEDHAAFTRRDGTLTTAMDVLVSGESDGEVRRVCVANGGRRRREIEMTSYAELALTTPAADRAHPAFAKMFVVTEYLPEFGALIATRRRRGPDEPEVWAAHFSVVEGEVAGDPQYETDRARFIGRGRDIGHAAAIVDGVALSNSVGTVLDPIFALRLRLRLPAGSVARVAFWTVVAPSRAQLLDLIDTHHDRSAYDRAKTLAWTQAQVQLRFLGVEAAEASAFQRLAAPLIYADPAFRAPSAAILRGAGAQSGLWPHAISGDLPIVLLRISDIDDIDQVQQLLRAHEYWRMKRLEVDLVIVNEHASSYRQDLQVAIDTAVRSSQSRPRFGHELARGSVYLLRADLMQHETRTLLQSVARVALIAGRGSLATQLERMPEAPARPPLPRPTPPSPLTLPAAAPEALEFFNGLGGFARDGREYVVRLEGDETTPAPWINVIANPGFGFQVSATGSGYTWAENSRENQLTPWSNDPVCDPTGEVFYVRDEHSGELWSPTAQPIRTGGTYTARHGYGYSRFQHEAHGIALDLLQYVPLADPVKISRLTLHNRSLAPRRLSVTLYAEWVLGTDRGASGPFITTEIDAASGALLARNPWSTAFPGRVAFADLRGRQTAWSADRSEFLGRHGGPAAPRALRVDTPLSGATGAGLDPCAALQCTVELEPGESVEVVALLGQCAAAAEVPTLLARYREADLDTVLDSVTDHWRDLLESVQVKTPDRAMDIMLNGWLLYQTIACRIRARSAFYQASGAYGFRDQLQDGMALSLASPETTREHLLRAAGRQFPEGDVQHWWLPDSGQGVRTRISDDRVWLAFAVATYILSSGDHAVLDEIVPFIEGPSLGPDEHDAFFQPMIADQSATLFEHCARALDQCLQLTGQHGLPLIGTGDWNDGMNRVGAGGQGESIWLGWLLVRTIELFAPLADSRDSARAQQWRAHRERVIDALEGVGWDGAWYRRATFDDGSWLGSTDSEACQIDSIAQSWAVLSGAADPERAATAMASLHRHLVREQDGLVLLFSPPFDQTARDPGYIQGYPPGLRENGGQYSHAAMWAMLAFAKLGDGDRASQLFALLNPINHGNSPAAMARYRVEPYVVAADVYSVAPHIGRGGWSWYTGAAGWMYRAGIEGILGIRREGDSLVIDPCITDTWPGFEASVTLGATRYVIAVENHPGHGRTITSATLDGSPLQHAGESLRMALDGKHHQLSIVIQPATQP